MQAEDPRAGGGHFKHVYLAVAGEDQQGGDVGAHRHEAVRLQRQLAGHAVDQVVADREDHKDKNGADDTNNVVIETTLIPASSAIQMTIMASCAAAPAVVVVLSIRNGSFPDVRRP